MGLAVFLAIGGLLVAYIVGMRVRATNRADAVRERQLVISNLGRRENSRPLRLHSRFSPLFLSSFDDTSAQNVENVLVLEDYPLLPLYVYGPWIEPGDFVAIIVCKDAHGNVLDIRLDH